jgi:2-oxoglutarate dehydrogenase complex dehydrogenase (E1) component-like enzyme
MLVSCGVKCVDLRRAETNSIQFLFQEEPLNNGAWSYVGPRVFTSANQTEHHRGKYPSYAGREPTGSVATGSKVRHSTRFRYEA